MLGYEIHELKGCKTDALLNIAGRIFYQTHFFPLIKLHNKAEEIFLSLLTKSRQEVPVLVNAKRKEIDQVAYNVCAVIPVNQRKEYEQQLLVAKKTAEDALQKNEHLLQLTHELETNKAALDRKIAMLTSVHNDVIQFSRIISHDVQEPVRKAAIFSDIMKQTGKPLTAESEMALEQIDISVQKLQQMIVSLQQYMSAGMLSKDEVAECDLTALAAEALQEVQAECKKNIQATLDRLPVLQGNPYQLQLLFYHLIKNAVEHNVTENVLVTIEGDIIQQNQFKHIKDKYQYIDVARIKISDNGPGFGIEYTNYIFGLFKKINPHTKGIGAGLALCKKITDNHFGSIAAETTPNEGTCITVHLPLKFPDES